MRAVRVVVKRVKQISRYEPETLEIEVELNEGEKVSDAVARARYTIAKLWGETPSESEVADLRRRLQEAEGDTF